MLSDRCLDENTLALLADGSAAESTLRLVEDHIDRCTPCAELAAAFARTCTGGGSSEPRLGDRLGRYEILGWLGRGSMGQVYVAEDPSLGRRVALKIVRPLAGGAPELERRLAREARAMARLSDHPNVVTVYDVGTAGERTFVAMELVEGTALDRYLRDRDLGWLEVAELYAAAGRGLAAAHSAGIVHRDFKPHNVLVGKRGQIKVGDFGLATTPAEEGGAATIDATSLAGTPAYMAPEQHRGEQATEASDQFAFAISMWESLYGERPFAGQRPDEIRAAVLAGDRRAPPKSEAPAALARICERALAVEPADRYPSMDALLADLDRLITRRRRRWGAIALVAGALVVFAAFTVHSLRRAEEPCEVPADRLAAVWGPGDRIAVGATLATAAPGYIDELAAQVLGGLDGYGQRWLGAYRQTCEATHLRGEQSEALLDVRMACLDRRLRDLGELVDLLGSDPALVDRAAQAVARLPAVERCRAGSRLEAARPDPPELVPVASRARAQLFAGKWTEAAAIGAPALEGRELRSAAAVELGHVVALATQRLGEHDEAEKKFQEVARAAAAIGDDVMVAEAYKSLTSLTVTQSRYDAAIAWAEAAERELLRLGPDHDAERAVVVSLRGAARDGLGQRQAADEAYAAAIELLGDDRGAWSYEAVAVFTNAAASYLSRNLVTRAIEAFEAATSIYERELGASHPRTLITLRNLAYARYRAGDPVRARGDLDRVIAGLVKVLPADDVEISLARQMLTEVLLALGELEAAEQQLDLAEAATGEMTRAIIHSNRGRLRAAQNRLEEALAEHRAALEIYRELGANNPAVAQEWMQVGVMLGQLQRYEEAERELTGAVAELERIHGAEAAVLAPALDNLGQIKIARGDCAGGVPLLERADVVHIKSGRPPLSSIAAGLGDCASRRGDHREALRLFATALERAEANHLDPVTVARARYDLGRAEHAAGKRRAGIATVRAARAAIADRPEASWLREAIDQWLRNH